VKGGAEKKTGRKSDAFIVAKKLLKESGAKEGGLLLFNEKIIDLNMGFKMIEEYIRYIKSFSEQNPNVRIQNLSSKVNKQALADLHQKMDARKAAGIDYVTKGEYSSNLEANLERLEMRLKLDRYAPKPSKRVHIPKAGGKLRPLGISCYEDKLVEANVAELLAAVYEPKFMNSSYGFRPERDCHQAISELRRQIIAEKTNFVVEADIKSFFDTMDHEWMMKFLEHDIADRKFLRLIGKFLKAGVMENGKFEERKEGTPQGSGISPVLANIYLHYVLDLWFEKAVKKECRGYAGIVRYADDFVCVFQYKSDAEKFMKELMERLKKFNLEAAPEKTKLIEFGKFAGQNRAARKEGKPETFNFLGFTLYCSKSVGGKFIVKLKTDRTRVAKKLKLLKEWLRKNRTMRTDELVEKLNKSLIGYYNYYYVSTNTKTVWTFVDKVGGLVFKWLNRRSQRKSYAWDEFKQSWVWLHLAKPRSPKPI
jgi:group II intron reverse transcriptase/maturase